jgi:hypothetical protein
LRILQKYCISREVVEIELHVRFYSNTLIQRSDFALFDAGFCGSAGEKGSPESLWCAPVDALEQHGELRRRQRYRAARLRQAWPEKIAAVDALGEQAQSRAIPKQDEFDG